jgi:hypothetical protein
MTNSKIIDLDKRLDIKSDEPVHTKQVKLFDRNWTIICDLNTFAMADIASGDAGSIARFIKNIVIEEQREDFALAISAAQNMTGERLGQLLSALIEVASERPTQSPSPSPRTAKKKTSGLKSVAH